MWRRPRRLFRALTPIDRWTLVALGVVLGAMNSVFYLAISRLPLRTVGAIEFLSPIVLTAIGARSLRNYGALALAVSGVYVLSEVRMVPEPLGILLAFANCALFGPDVFLGHRIAQGAAR